MTTLKPIAPLDPSIQNEPDVESTVATLLRSPDMGYEVKFRKAGIADIDKNWPSKNHPSPSARRAKPTPGQPDLLVYLPGSQKPICVWENKSRSEKIQDALNEAKFYIEGLHRALPGEPALPRLAAGCNGEELVLSYFTSDGNWVPVKANGDIVKDSFPVAEFLQNGISEKGVLTALSGAATAKDLREALWKLKTLYRRIPPLAPGTRRPIDFTVALLTVRLLVEQHPDWGTWAEQPALQLGSPNREQRIAERLLSLADRILADPDLKERYGNIFEFKEQEAGQEVAFSFKATLGEIPRDSTNFADLFAIIDGIPPLLEADFDVFGEVYQYIGDEATKKALGEFFTPRHIIGALLPVFFHRAGWDSSFNTVQSKSIGDVACGTGGFLTETLRLVRRLHHPAPSELKRFAQTSFFGFDLGATNAARARVNMYFAGDGFAVIRGGVDSLDNRFPTAHVPDGGFDAILTNPPYGQSAYGRSEEAFLRRILDALKPGEGWGLVVLPTGVLENPRSQGTRFHLLKIARVTDVVALPRHAFAPYTQQRTAIVMFRKRPSPVAVADGDWDGLQRAIGNEQIAMYIVDNDGFANSDKRYPTDRKDDRGKWLHNDLADWQDESGSMQPSDLYNGLVNQIPPTGGTNEFGKSLGPKYDVRRVRELAVPESGIVLLPDVFLRTTYHSIPVETYIADCNKIVEFRRNPDAWTEPLIPDQ